ncbi:MAG: ATP-grasp domain-containing protein [Planctomycetota bacterium]
MHHCVFAAPFALENTLRFVRAATHVPDVRIGVVSQEPIERLPDDLRARLAGFAQVRDALSGEGLVLGVRELERRFGHRVDSLVGILEQLQVPLADARAKLGLPGTSPDAARNFRDKARMKETLRAHGLPCARHALVVSHAEALQQASSIGYPLVAKPPAGAGAKSTVRVENPEQLRAHLAQCPPSSSEPLLLEEFVQGREFSFDSVSIAGKHVFHSVSTYTPTPLEVVQNPWIQWNVLLPRELDSPDFHAIFSAGPRALDALGMHTGMTHMEWFRRDDGSIAISEVAARPPGAQFTSLLSLAHDTDFYVAWARLVTHGHFEVPARKYAAGAAYLRAQGHGHAVRSIRGLEDVRRELGGLVVEAKLPRPGQAPSGSYEGEGYVLLRHPDTAVVRDALRRIVELVRVDLG